MLVKKETFEKHGKVLREIKAFASLAEKPDFAYEASVLSNRCDDFVNGLFDIFVIGDWGSGKSTLINALTGEKLAYASVFPNIPFFVTMKYGDDYCVDVVHADGSILRYSREQFEQEFTLSYEEQLELSENGTLEKIENISRVVMYGQNDLLRNGLCLTDSPGFFEYSDLMQQERMEYQARADAIIYVFNACRLFSTQEKDYIAENFAGKHMRNVFFIINKIDILSPGQLENAIVPALRTGLEDVFLDDNGNFDEELYKRRVFFINSYGALCVKTNKPYKIYVGRKEVEIPIDFEDTGILEFENALRDYLNQDGLFQARFGLALNIMKQIYQSDSKELYAAELHTEEDLAELDRRDGVLKNLFHETMDKIANFEKKWNSISERAYARMVKYMKIDLPRELHFPSARKEMTDKLELQKSIFPYAISKKKWDEFCPEFVKKLHEYFENLIERRIEEIYIHFQDDIQALNDMQAGLATSIEALLGDEKVDFRDIIRYDYLDITIYVMIPYVNYWESIYLEMHKMTVLAPIHAMQLNERLLDYVTDIFVSESSEWIDRTDVHESFKDRFLMDKRAKGTGNWISVEKCKNFIQDIGNKQRDRFMGEKEERFHSLERRRELHSQMKEAYFNAYATVYGHKPDEGLLRTGNSKYEVPTADRFKRRGMG